MSRSQLVRASAKTISTQSQWVTLNQQALNQQVQKWIQTNSYKYLAFEEYDCHLTSAFGDEVLLEYLFALDSLNFCFWPQKEYEYDDLSQALKTCILKDKNAFQPQSIIQMTFEQFKQNVFLGIDFPLIHERYRLLQDSASIVVTQFGGKYSNLIKEAGQSCQKLLYLLTSLFIGFQDHAIYKGQQVFFYKRSQILISDIYAAFKGESLGKFNDIAELTTFPDYRVPQILLHFGILEYKEELLQKLKNHTQIPHGSEEEIEIRAYTVLAVEVIKEEFKKQGVDLLSIEIDWLLWQLGEKDRNNILPHHRTLSIYY